MPWLYLLLALGAFALALGTTSMALVVVCLLAALVFMALWVIGLLGRRIDDRARDDMLLIDPQELRRLREQAQARRVSDGSGEPPATAG